MAGQLGVLNALDVAKTQWYHFTAIVIAGMGFFTDAYDLFCISLVTKLLGRIYYTDPTKPEPGVLPPNVQRAATYVPLFGTLAGQLFFGWLGDKLGRKKVYGLTLMLMVVCSFASGLSFGSSAKGVMATLCFFRFWLSFGIGGNYSLSPTIVSEYANKRTRGTFIAGVFAMQGFGILAGGIVVLIVSSAFDHSYKVPTYQEDAKASLVLPAFDYVWRIILMFGAVPAAITYYGLMKMPETARYTALVAKNAKKAASDMSKVLQVELEAEKEMVQQLTESQNRQYGLFSKEFANRHGLYLVGTTITSFLSGIGVYSQILYQKDIFRATGWVPPAEEMNAIHEVYRIARAQIFIALVSMPGYWFTVALIDFMGRVNIQVIGFAGMSAFMFATAPYKHWTKKENSIWFVVLYSFYSFFSNFGPNATTFVVPAEIFPARLRATCHGISAAAGRAGAIVGAFWFSYAAHKDPTKFMMVTFIMLGVINLIGVIITIFVPESKGKTLEELSGENEDDGAEAIEMAGSARTAPV